MDYCALRQLSIFQLSTCINILHPDGSFCHWTVPDCAWLHVISLGWISSLLTCFFVMYHVSCPLPGKSKTLWHFHQAVHAPCMYLSLYVPCLVRVRPHFRNFHQAVCVPCMYLSLYVPCLVRVRPHFRHFHQAVCTPCMYLS